MEHDCEPHNIISDESLLVRPLGTTRCQRLTLFALSLSPATCRPTRSRCNCESWQVSVNVMYVRELILCPTHRLDGCDEEAVCEWWYESGAKKLCIAVAAARARGGGAPAPASKAAPARSKPLPVPAQDKSKPA